MEQERGQVRHYLTTRATSWNGEVEVTCLAYVAVRGPMLYVEFLGTALPGIASAYHRIDTMAVLDGVSVLSILARSFAGSFTAPVQATVRLVSESLRAVSSAIRGMRESWTISRQVGYDYGARTSVREIGSRWADPVFFQTVDATQHIRTVERSIVTAVADFLHANGYDTSEFDNRANIVFNHGVTITNSTVNGSAFAVGKGSASRAAPVAAAAPPTAGGSK
jgi:hypothetical protein